MTKFFDLVLCFTMLFGIAGLSQSSMTVTEKTDIEAVIVDTICTEIDSCFDTICVNNEIEDCNIHYEKGPNEWYAFEESDFKYDYKPIPYTEEELNVYTNIIYRETGMGLTTNAEVDKYFVAIVGIMRILCENDRYKTITDMVSRSNSFTYPTYGNKSPFDSISRPLEYKCWMLCRDVAQNVLNGTIPSYVPYLPYGTFCYWNDKNDTNMKQKYYLETRGMCVATTCWGHSFYVIKGYERKEEIQYLIDNDRTCNPTPKIISNGILCNNTYASR
jgi:hypothetical protein